MAMGRVSLCYSIDLTNHFRNHIIDPGCWRLPVRGGGFLGGVQVVVVDGELKPNKNSVTSSTRSSFDALLPSKLDRVEENILLKSCGYGVERRAQQEQKPEDETHDGGGKEIQ